MRYVLAAGLGLACVLTLQADDRPKPTTSGKWKVIGWNDLGMHCMDGKDYSIYSILPPYNTFHAHVIDGSGKLIRSPSQIRVVYRAVADPDGSFNSTSVGKTNFWQFVSQLFGVTLAPDMGLAGFAMPGAGNRPQLMSFDPARNWFSAEGVPITPYDDQGRKNYYPLMRIAALDQSGVELARTDIVLPVSDELDCRSCHASNSPNTARPAAGWVNNPDPERDYKLNVLRLHDDREMPNSSYRAALAAKGYLAAGLYATVTESSKPILCAACHGSNALPGTGISGVTPLTQAVHKRHAFVLDPNNNLQLNAAANRSACYRCHPGSETKCLRGAMGNATASDGTMLMQCQSCHGNMLDVAGTQRQGWLQQPSCQNCHTGTATRNNGQIRYTSAFVAAGVLRIPVDATFATNNDTPAPGLNLYRFSKGHGGLQCEACHGSTHAEYPSSHRNDNLQSIRLQGHAGTLVECTACHLKAPETVNGGPHGLHPVGSSWVDKHEGAVERLGAGQCAACHGSDFRGTVLSRMSMTRTLKTKKRGLVSFAAGTEIGCYNCHNGPRGE